MDIRKGNYKIFYFQRKDLKGNIITEKPDEVYFTVKRDESSDNILIQKKMNSGINIDENNVYHIEVLPKDTKEMMCGKYLFDITIIKDNKPKTIIVDTFEVKPVVTSNISEVN